MAEFGHCSYHPDQPKIRTGANEGVFQCCGARAFRFDTSTVIMKTGCKAQDHLVCLTADVDNSFVNEKGMSANTLGHDHKEASRRVQILESKEEAKDVKEEVETKTMQTKQEAKNVENEVREPKRTRKGNGEKEGPNRNREALLGDLPRHWSVERTLACCRMHQDRVSVNFKEVQLQQRQERRSRRSLVASDVESTEPTTVANVFSPMLHHSHLVHSDSVSRIKTPLVSFQLSTRVALLRQLTQSYQEASGGLEIPEAFKQTPSRRRIWKLDTQRESDARRMMKLMRRLLRVRTESITVPSGATPKGSVIRTATEQGTASGKRSNLWRY